MESLFKPPEPFTLEGNVAEQWKKFVQRFELFMVATDLGNKEESKQIAVFLSLIGEEGLELYNSFSVTEEESKSLESIKRKFNDYCAPKKNIIFERYKFNSLVQKEGQIFDSFLTELRKAVKTTEYKDPEEMIRDRIVMGVSDKGIQERLLRESDLTLEKAITFCRAVEASKTQCKELQKSEAGVNAVKKGNPNKYNEKQCTFCGYKHLRGKCPAYGKTCDGCKGKNHFASVCKKKIQLKNKKIHEVAAENKQEEDEEESEFFISSLIKKVNAVNSKSREVVWLKMINIKGQDIEFKLDSGAEVSVF